MIEKYEKYSKILNRNVTTYIRLPKNFESSKTYNIMYMHDGQNLFFKEDSSFNMIWDVDETLTRMEASGYEELIVVGLSSDPENIGINRYSEYSYFDGKEIVAWMNENNTYEEYKHLFNNGVLEAKGHHYEQFLIEEVFGSIESRYSVNKRYMMGSSMGGYFTLCFALRNPLLLNKAYCISNAFHYASNDALELCKNIDTKIYLDCGTHESSSGANNEAYLQANKQFYDKLKECGNDVVYEVYQDAIHNEKAWASRLEKILKSI